MWLSDKGQTTTILAPISAARTNQVMGARRTDRRINDRHASANANGVSHQTSSGRSSRMMAVSVRTESGTPSWSLVERSSGVHPIDEVARAAMEGRQRSRCVLDAPRLDTDGLHWTVIPGLARHHTACQSR